MIDELEEAGQKAAARAEAQWNLDVFDPPIGSSHARAKFCLDTIEKIIARNGWSWALPYRGDGPPQWCGMFAGDCWAEAGLDTTWLAAYFASTYRLMAWVTYQRVEGSKKQNPKPSISAQHRLYVNLRQKFDITPRAGDIVIVGDGAPTWGDHITICMGYTHATKTFNTISGNGGGVGPRGNVRQGISRRNYRIGQSGYAPMFLIRPASTDLL